MTMNVVLPNGTTIQDVPDGTTKAQIMQKAIASGLATEADFQQAAQQPAAAQTSQPQQQQQQQQQFPLGAPVSTSESDGFVNAHNADGIVIASARIGTPEAEALKQAVGRHPQQQQQSAPQPQSTAPQQEAAPAPAQAPSDNQAASAIPATTPQGGSTPQNTDSILAQTVQGIDEAGKAIAQSAVNVANIVPEVGDAIQSAAAWAGNKVGLGDGTYTPAARFSLPEQMQPQTEAGKVASNVLPYLVPGVGAERAATAAGAAASGNVATRAATGLSRMAADTVPGALAQNSQQDNPNGLAADLASGVAGGVVAKGVSSALSPIVSRVAQAISNRGAPEAQRAAMQAERQATVAPGMTPQQAVDQVAPPTQSVTQATPSAAELGDVARAANQATGANASQQATQQFAQQVVPDQQVLESAKRLGLEESLTPGMYSQNPAYRAFEIAQSVTPGTKMFAAKREAMNRLAQEADSFITDFGGNTDKSFVNHQVRTKYTGLIDELKNQSDTLYSKVREKVPTRAVVNPEKTLKMIDDMADDAGGYEAFRNLYPQANRVLKQLQPTEESVGRGAASKVTPVTYGRIDRVRQLVGKALGSKINQGPFSDMDQRELNMLYGSLSEDQGVAAKAFGAGDLWDAAKKMYTVKQQVQTVAQANIGKNLTGSVVQPIQQSIVDMAKGNGTKFRALTKDLPDDLKQGVILTAMNGAFTSFAKNPSGQMGVPGFYKWYLGMSRNKENLQTLNNAIGYQAARRLHNIFVVAKAMNPLIAGPGQGGEMVYSSGQINNMLKNFDKEGGFLTKLYGVGRAAAKAEGVTTAMHLPGVGTAHAIVSALNAPKVNRTVAADELMSSPLFRDMTKKINDPARARDAAERALENSRVYKNWLNTVTPEERSRLIRQGIVGVLASPEVTGSQDNFANTGS